MPLPKRTSRPPRRTDRQRSVELYPNSDLGPDGLDCGVPMADSGGPGHLRETLPAASIIMAEPEPSVFVDEAARRQPYGVAAGI